jgi:hypothetical protein
MTNLTTDPKELIEVHNVPSSYSYANEKKFDFFRALLIYKSPTVFLYKIETANSSYFSQDSLVFENLDLDQLTEEDCFLIYAYFKPNILFKVVKDFIKREKQHAYSLAQQQLRNKFQDLLFGEGEW